MKLSAILLGVVAAQEGDDRWSFYDYHIPAGGKVGHAVSGIGTAGHGGHEGNRRYCHSTLDTVHIYRWDVTMNGYFAHFNPVECLGEELFCHIEERAHFGQIIGIRAGCAQMMNHPQVSTAASVTVSPELKNHYNQEAARGATFQQGTNGPVTIFYGIGGCLALPAQNGYDTYHTDFQSSMEANYFMGTHGGYGMNQCLRQQRFSAKTPLLPFGVSVCRACCLADNDYFSTNGGNAQGPCNFWPFGNGAGKPIITDAMFDCSLEDGTTACPFDSTTTNASTCRICRKEMFPNFSMFLQPDYDVYTNLFQIDQGSAAFCDMSSTCTPEFVYGGSQPIAGGGR